MSVTRSNWPLPARFAAEAYAEEAVVRGPLGPDPVVWGVLTGMLVIGLVAHVLFWLRLDAALKWGFGLDAKSRAGPGE